jgi:hypothetical protein
LSIKHDEDVRKMGNGLLSSLRIIIDDSLKLLEFCADDGDDVEEQEELVNEEVGDGLDLAGEGMWEDDEFTLWSNMGSSLERV